MQWINKNTYCNIMANTKQQNINIDKIKKSMYNICQILYKYVYKNLQFKDKINNKSNKN